MPDLFNDVLYSTLLYHTMVNYTLLYYTIPYYTTLHSTRHYRALPKKFLGGQSRALKARFLRCGASGELPRRGLGLPKSKRQFLEGPLQTYREREGEMDRFRYKYVCIRSERERKRELDLDPDRDRDRDGDRDIDRTVDRDVDVDLDSGIDTCCRLPPLIDSWIRYIKLLVSSLRRLFMGAGLSQHFWRIVVLQGAPLHLLNKSVNFGVPVCWIGFPAFWNMNVGSPDFEQPRLWKHAL